MCQWRQSWLFQYHPHNSSERTSDRPTSKYFPNFYSIFFLTYKICVKSNTFQYPNFIPGVAIEIKTFPTLRKLASLTSSTRPLRLITKATETSIIKRDKRNIIPLLRPRYNYPIIISRFIEINLECKLWPLIFVNFYIYILIWEMWVKYY